ncbi:hypothetical protein HaLaN_23914 [Haematococcus lacustris]|uniref:Uncharacterized protein n=1 Tax=Haematococcus lacustris TaxID=44745 RepID=A0A699ZVC6_HAELA|nr:hypothetical protein HaLaN_23914 [Haematococcus lacustris]
MRLDLKADMKGGGILDLGA